MRSGWHGVLVQAVGKWIPMLGQRHGIPVKKDKYQFPGGEVMGLAGTKEAGNLLDGKLYEERPTPRGYVGHQRSIVSMSAGVKSFTGDDPPFSQHLLS